MFGAILHNIIGFFATFIGRPLLLLIAWFRWPLLVFGIYFNTMSTYNLTTGETSHKFTIIPLLTGLALFSVGSAVKRYEEFYNIHKKSLKNIGFDKKNNFEKENNV